MQDATELVPFTFEQKNALRDCRFVTTNVARTMVIAETADKAVADAVGVASLPWQPDKGGDPGRWEYELTTSHPDAIGTAVEIMERQAAARGRVLPPAPAGDPA